MYRTRGARVAFALCCATAFLGGCTPANPTYVDEGRVYTISTVATVTSAVEIGKVAGADVSSAKVMRHDALVALRSSGSGGSEAANLITRTFPSQARSVPLYVERASLGDRPVWILVEAVGPKDGKLADKRVWVIGDDGEILYAATR